jgi:hypothetical protein
LPLAVAQSWDLAVVLPLLVAISDKVNGRWIDLPSTDVSFAGKN